METGEVGKYKVAYVKDGDSKTLCSDMYDSYGEALAGIESKNLKEYFLFQAKKIENGYYEWEILPKSLYTPYRIAWTLKKFALEILIVIVAILAYYMYYKHSKSAA